MSRKEKKEEERRILAELDEAVEKEQAETQPQGEKLHCKRCKTLMENGVCPACGFKIYVGMSEEKRKKIRTAVTCVCLGVFLILLVILQAK